MLVSSFFSAGLTSPSRPTKKLKMADEKNIASNSRLKKPELPEYVRYSSNLRQSSCRPAHHDFSNTVDDPIEVEKVENPSKNSEQGSAFGEDAQVRMIPRIMIHIW